MSSEDPCRQSNEYGLQYSASQRQHVRFLAVNKQPVLVLQECQLAVRDVALLANEVPVNDNVSQVRGDLKQVIS
jgi:hypothetical protein